MGAAVLCRNAFAFLILLTLSLPAGESLSAPLVLNEYNAVREDSFLAEGGVDTRFGTVLGNGSFGPPVGARNDWIELVVIADHLDIRGWQLQMVDDGNPQPPLVFSSNPLWADLRAGTIVTIFESDDIPEDVAYDPAMGDWTIEIRANDDASGVRITASDFDVSNDDFRLTIVDAEGRIMFGPAGEGISPPVGIGSGEVFELEADPSALVAPNAPDYDDGKSSTFGAPNQWDGDTVQQDFSALRGGTPLLDADFDGIADCRDNCRETWNLVQTNTDDNRFGNACDCDFDQSGSCNISDFNVFLPDFQSGVDSGSGTDMDGSGSVGIDDFNLFLPGFATGEPGPGAVSDPACDVFDPTEVLFDPDRLLVVNIRIDQSDWNVLRYQELNLFETFLSPDCGTRPWVGENDEFNPYTFFPSEVTVDGTTLTNVGVRKKGFQGSLSTTEPSFKVKFDEFVGGQQYQGMDRLTLNNNLQDPAEIKQCVTYYLMRKAGLPAPRCNFAHVTVTVVTGGGDTTAVDQVYSHVESIKDPFLRRNFGSDNGRLYEGTLSDFWSLSTGSAATYRATIEPKTAEAKADTSEVDALTSALENGGLNDAQRLAAIEALVDLDAYLTFWAAEGMTGHWDGYMDNQNNFWFYVNPADGLIDFIPWGTDDTLGQGNPLRPSGSGGSHANAIVPRSALARRLYAIPSVQTQYLARLQLLMDTVFDEAELQAEIDRMEALIAPITGDISSQINAVRGWIDAHRASVQAEINSPPAGFSDQQPHFCDCLLSCP